MSETGTFYIVTVAGGKCLENTQGAQGVLDCLPKEDSKAQKWIIESGDDQNTVAIRSAADGQYLRNNEPNKINWGRIGMGEKQWWTLEKGRFPGSCAIRSNACTAGASYLNDFQGKYQDNNYVHMWQMEKPLDFWLTWYFKDAGNVEFTPAGIASTGAGKAAGQNAEQDEKAEQDAARMKDLEQREAALKKKEKELAAREEELKKKEKELAARKEELKKKQSAPAPKAAAATPPPKQQQQQQQQPQQCGHKVYPPPRKLEKKVVGFLYEGQGVTAR